MADDVSDDNCDSWEDMIENGVLDKKLEELKVKSIENNSKPVSTSQDHILMTPRMTLEDSGRTQYVISVPQLKILKRPTDARGTGAGQDRSPSKQPLKSLEQREQEYAQARLRILGSAKHQDETQENGTVRIVSLNNDSSNCIIRQPRGPDGSNGFHQSREQQCS